jgi:hypothetical protein
MFYSSLRALLLLGMAAFTPLAHAGTTIHENNRHDMAAGEFGVAWIYGPNVMRSVGGNTTPAILLAGVNATKIIGADVNGDGHQDLVYLGAGGGLYYYNFQNSQTMGPFPLSPPAGSFSELTAGAFKSGQVQDYLVLASSATGALSYFDGVAGTFGTIGGSAFRSITRGNYKADNLVDEFYLLTTGNAASLYTPNGTGSGTNLNRAAGVVAIVSGDLTSATGDESWQTNAANAVSYNENIPTTNTTNATGLTAGTGAGLVLATGNFDGAGFREGAVLGADARISIYTAGVGAAVQTPNNGDFATFIFADLNGNGTEELYAIKASDRGQLWRYDTLLETDFVAFGAASPLITNSVKTVYTGTIGNAFPDFASGSFLSGTVGSSLKVANLNGVGGILNSSVAIAACPPAGLPWLEILGSPTGATGIAATFSGPTDYVLRNGIASTALRSATTWTARFTGLTPGVRYRLQLLTADGTSGATQRNFDIFVGAAQAFDNYKPPQAGVAPYAGIAQFEAIAGDDGAIPIVLQPGSTSVSAETGPSVNAVAIAQVDTALPPPGLVSINEFMASNSTGLKDVDGDASDWIEIYNGQDTAVNLLGWRLTDNASDLSKWVFPSVSVPARSFLVVFASGKDRAVAGAQLHTNFSLSSSGEYLALVTPDGQIVSAWSPTYPEQITDESYGPSRPITAAEPPGSPEFQALQRYFNIPTPGTTNYTNPEIARVAKITASVGRGFYTTAQSVSLSTATPGTTIYYTFDGSTPTAGAATTAIYSSPITINKTTTLRYFGVKANFVPTEIVTQTYVFTVDVKNQALNNAVTGGANPVITNPPGAAQPTTAWARGTFGSPYYRVNSQILDYGMDSDVVNSAAYAPLLESSLKSIPSFSIVTDLNNLFDPSTGIYVNPSLDTIAAERRGSLELIYPDGKTGFQINCGVRLRGGYSRDPSNPKHSFRFFFRNEYGESKLKFPIFGDDPTATDTFDKFDLRTAQNYSWSFAGDGSNFFVGDQFCRLAQLAMGQVSSHSMHAHLYVNGQYWGLYNLDERPEANFGETYFGGDADTYDTVKTAPEDAKIIPADGNLDAWTAFWTQADALAPGTTPAVGNAAYQKMKGCNPDGSRNLSYPVYLDPENLIDYMIAIYWSGNLDAAVSNFFSNDRGNNWFGVRDRTGASGGFRFILHDSEHTLRDVNVNRLGTSTGIGWQAGDTRRQAYQTALNGSTPQYICTQLLQYSPDFSALWADRVYRHLFNNGALTPAVSQARLDFLDGEIRSAMIAESARWGDSKNASGFLQSDYISAITGIRNGFLVNRGTVFISQLRSWGWYPTLLPTNWSTRGGVVAIDSTVTLTNPNGAGTIYYTLDGSDPRALGGTVAVGALTYSGPIPINVSKTIRTRILNGTVWSPSDTASFFALQDFSKLIVSEINYNPLQDGATSGDEFEFLEFKNIGSLALKMDGLLFDSGITYAFPSGTTIAPGAFFVLARNAAKMAVRYPNVTVNGIYTGKLDNSGESLTIIHPVGGVILDFSYGDGAPWPATADGAGFTLVPINPATHTNPGNAATWRGSTQVGGSPGMDDPASTIPGVVINEILSNSASPQTDYVELYNPTGAAADVSDWWLSDGSGNLQKYRISAGTIIPAGGYLTLTEANFNPTPGFGTSFSFNGDGEQVYLSSGNTAGELTGYNLGIEFPAAEPNVSFGRYFNSLGVLSFPAQASRTLGGVNSSPLVGPVVINEIQFRPLTDFDEYVELKNLSGATINLWDPALPANTWRISGLDYNLPMNATIPANGFSLVVNIDPAAFRTKYQIPANVPIYGPYPGGLDNGGERLTVQKPSTPFVDNDGQTVIPYIEVDTVRYSATAPWPLGASGLGPSLQRVASAAFGDDPVNWFASGITPGRENTVNQPPTVAIASPANGATFTLPTTITLVTNAADADGYINKVEYYDGATKIGESSVAPYTLSWSTATAGTHVVTARAIDSGLSVTVSAGATITVSGSSTPNGTGLKGDYYNDPDATTHLTGGIVSTILTTQINFSEDGVESASKWPKLIVPAFPDNNTFSVRWTGQLVPAKTAVYTLYTVSDDGVRLYINGQAVINNWGDHSPTTNTASVTLEAGQTYDVILEFYENAGGAQITLEWEAASAGIARQFIPTSNLYPPGAPSIISHPANVSLTNGNTVTFSVLAIGTGLSYQWQYNNADIVGATGKSLVIQDPLLTNIGNYRVKVTNGSGTAFSNPGTLSIPDTDGDGLPNYWETLNGLSTSANDADVDSDGDGKSNAAEYQAGTNPLNPASQLAAAVTTLPANGGYAIAFVAQNNRAYTVQYKAALTDATWLPLQQVSAAYGVRTVTVTDATLLGQRFYRVVTPQQ